MSSADPTASNGTVEERGVQVEEGRLALDQDRFEFERERLRSADKKADGFIHKFFGNLPAAISFAGVVIAGAQIYSTHQSNARAQSAQVEASLAERELQDARNKNENDRAWKLALLSFVTENRDALFGENNEERTKAITLLEVVFPSKYWEGLTQRLSISIQSSKGDATAEFRSESVAKLLRPVVERLEAMQSLLNEPAGTKPPRGRRPNHEEMARIADEVRSRLLDSARFLPDSLRQHSLKVLEYCTGVSRVREQSEGSPAQAYQGPSDFDRAWTRFVTLNPFPADALEAFRRQRDAYGS